MKKIIPIIRERERNEKKAFPEFGNRKGMKKNTPMIQEWESEAFILGNGSERDVLIRQPPTCLSSTSNFLTNTMIITVVMVIMVTKVIMAKMVIIVAMDIMVIRTDRTTKTHWTDRTDKEDKEDRQIWHLNLTFQVTYVGQLSQVLQFLFFFNCILHI